MVVPAALVATKAKKYFVFGDRPVKEALTLCTPPPVSEAVAGVFPLSAVALRP